MNFRKTIGMASVLTLGFAALAWSQIQIGVGGQVAAPAPPPQPSDQPQQQVSMLESNADADALFNKAHDYIADEQYREALLLLQAINDRYGSYLTEGPGNVYQPARALVERMIANWSQTAPDALNLYRITADAEARGVLGGTASQSTDLKALRQVVERYFLASEGDDAAFQLGCLLMNAGRFRDAALQFSKIVDDYPDPSVSRVQVLSRLAIAHARSGNRPGFERAMALLKQAPPDRATLDLALAQEQLLDEKRESRGLETWSMAFGNPQRDGVMQGLGDAGATGQNAVWSQLWDADQPGILPKLREGVRVTGSQVPVSRSSLLKRWVQNQWRPTSQAVLDAGKVYFKLGRTIVCADAQMGEVLWTVEAKQPKTQTNAYYRNWGTTGAPSWPTGPEEVALFGDRVATALSLDGSTLFHIDEVPSSTHGNNTRFVMINNRMTRAPSGNVLEAIDLNKRKPRWRATVPSRAQAPDEKTHGLPATSFLTPPVRVGNHLLTCIEDQGELHLVALDPARGKLLWRKFICSAPSGYAPPWAPVGLMVEGEQTYIATGRGLLICADAMDGQVRWASRYRRAEQPSANYRTSPGQQWAAGGQPWDENAIFSVGGTLVLAAADSTDLHLFDQQTGQRRISVNTTRRGNVPARQYVLGTMNGRVFIASPSEVSAFDAQTGKLKWRSPIPESSGRAVLTDQAIYAPIRNSIVRIDPNNGKWLSRAPVSDRMTDPIGNLYSDGQHLLSIHIDGVSALGDVNHELKRLEPRLAAGDALAFYQRARLYDDLGKPTLALEDLRIAFKGLKGPIKERARDALIVHLVDLADQQEATAPKMLAEADALANTASQRAMTALARGSYFEKVGQIDNAIELYRKFAMASESSMIAVDPGEPDWKVSATHLGASRLAKLVARGGTAAEAAMESRAADALAALPADANVDALWALIQSHPGTASSFVAMQRIVDQTIAPTGNGFAQGESVLRELGRSDHAPTAGTAMMALANNYQQRGWLNDASAIWRDLSTRLPDVEIQTEQGPDTLGALADGQLKSLATQRAASVDPRRLGDLPLEVVWETRAAEEHLLTLTGDMWVDGTDALRQRVLMYVPARRRIICRDPAQGWKAIWSKQLPDDVEANVRRSGAVRWLRGSTAGNMLVIFSPTRTVAIDMVDGQQLWEHKTKRSVQPNRYQYYYYAQRGLDDTGSVGSGVLAEIDWDRERGADTVRVRDMATGELMWQRTPEENIITGVQVHGQWVMIGMGHDRIWLCDARTGRLVREVALEGYNQNAYIIPTSHGLVYQSGRNIRFAPFDKDTRAWHIDGNDSAKMLRTLHDINDEVFVASWLNGETSLIDVRTGKQLWRLNANKIGRNVFDASMGDDGLIYVLANDNKNQQQVRAFDSKGNQVKQVNFTNQQAQQRTLTRTLAHAGPIVPFLERDGRNHSRFKVQLYRLSDSNRIATLAGPKGHNFDNPYQPPQIRGNCLIVNTRYGLVAFGPKALGANEEVKKEADEQAKANQPVDGAENITIQTQNGQIQVRMGGGVIRAQNIKINNMEIKQKDGVIEIYRDGKLVERREAGKKAPAPQPAKPDQQDKTKE